MSKMLKSAKRLLTILTHKGTFLINLLQKKVPPDAAVSDGCGVSKADLDPVKPD